MMECWNSGIMGLKEFFYNLNGIFSAFIPNIPAFHHSSIPSRWHKQGAINKAVFSINCRIPETLN
jgi:hypothetical protein